MPGDYFWGCVEAMSAMFDGDAKDAKSADDNLKAYSPHYTLRLVESNMKWGTSRPRVVRVPERPH